MNPKTRVFLPTVLFVLVADIITKTLVEGRLVPHMAHEVIGSLFRLTLSYNTGAAFGLQWFGASRWMYVLFTVIILVILVSMLRDAHAEDRWQALALGLIVGGALGNAYDRIRWDRGVVDFIDVGIGDARFWTFNIADSGITVGAVTMVIIFILQSRQAKRAAPEPAQVERGEQSGS